MKISILLMAITMMLSGVNAQAQSAKKVLVVYYSYSGNTREVAHAISEATGGVLFEIVPTMAYPSEYRAVVDQAKKEIGAGFRPELKTRVADLARYDVIFVGSPCWWYTFAPPVASFLAGYDFSGKTIVPFMTHEGSGMGHSEDDIRKLCPGATVLKGLPVRGGSVKNSREAVMKWVRDAGLVK